MSLYIKHRPQSLGEVIGNEALVNSLKSLLQREEGIPHSFLFTGPSGCGKTTVGRILANELGCSPEDFKEIDSADFRGIDSVREIRKQARFSPINGPCRVWLLDEVHKMTNDAQNALLKALEDTPSHVYFILCTTDPQKLLKTIKTRCSPYEVESLDSRQLVKLIRQTAKSEGKSIPKDVRQQIAKDSLGSARQALVLLDKIIDLPEDEMLAAAEKSAEEESEVIELCRILMNPKCNWKNVSKVLKGINQEPESVRRAVLGYFSAVLLNSGKPIAAHVIECFQDHFYDSGKAGLVLSCFQAVENTDNVPF